MRTSCPKIDTTNTILRIMIMLSNQNNKTSAQLIKEKRIRLNMTQKELADAVGMPKFGDRTIRRWEKGESSPNNLELEKILDFTEEIPFPNKIDAKYKMIDLFAGIGGTRLGFYLTGKVNVIFSSEFNKFSVKTYMANFGMSLQEISQKLMLQIFQTTTY